MSKIEEKIDKAAIIAAANYDNPFDEPTYDKEFYDGFKAGAKWALSNQWVSVEDALPENDDDVFALSICGKSRNMGIARCWRRGNGTIAWYSDDVNADYIRYWMTIPPLPEARKEGER